MDGPAFPRRRSPFVGDWAIRSSVRTHYALALGVLLILVPLTIIPPPTPTWEVDRTDTVTRVIDGDTFNTTLPTGVRLADIDAPESYETGYQAAKDYLTGLIGGRTVYLDIDDVYGTDVYGRWVAVAYVRYNDTHLLNVNQAMLDGGHAVIWDFTNEFDPTSWSRYVFYPIDAPAPTVAASADVTEGTAPLTVIFTSTASGGIPPYSYLWMFGDGTTSSAPNPVHAYTTGGAFTATVTVRDAALRSGSQSVAITVHAPLAVTPTANRTAGTSPLVVSFSAGAGGGSPPYSYLWTFGDGATSTLASPTHTYAVPGTYTATVTVTDTENHTVVESLQISVSQNPPASENPPPVSIESSVAAAGIAAGLAAAGVASLLIYRHRRRVR